MNLGDIFLGEFIGTAILILLGNGVVANVTFKKTGGSKSGLIVIAFGWAFAVFTGVAVANLWSTGGHLNPAVTIGQMVGGKIDAAEGFTYFGAELAGALVGQIIVMTFYWKHIQEETMGTVLGASSTGPTHEKAIFNNLFSEYVGTILLVVMAFFAIQSDWFGEAPFAIALTVLVIGLSLGGTTGYAINPARDLMPRIVHFITYKTLANRMEIKIEKVDSNWSYAWIPVIAPLAAGATVGAFLHL